MPGTQRHDLHVWTRLNDARAFMSSKIFSWPVLSRESSAIVIIIRRTPCRCTGLHIRSSSLFTPFSPWQCFNTLSVYSTRRNVFSTALNASELFSRQVFLRIDFRKSSFFKPSVNFAVLCQKRSYFPVWVFLRPGSISLRRFWLESLPSKPLAMLPRKIACAKGQAWVYASFPFRCPSCCVGGHLGRCPGSSARRAWRNARPVVTSRRRHAGTEPLLFVVKFHVDFTERFCLKSAS